MSEGPNTLFERGIAENDEVAQGPVINSGIMASERLGTLYSECLASFQRFLVRCSQNDRLNSSRGLEKCFEEYSRLKIWGHQQGAALKPSVRGSLPSTLQGHPELQGILFEIYEQAIDGFNQLGLLPPASLAESLDLLEDEYNNSSSSEVQSDISDSSSAGDEPDLASSILKCIFESIKELYRFNSLIRRPRLTGRYLHSTQPILDSTYQQEYQYVRQKFLLWQKEQEDETLRDRDKKTASKVVSPPEEETADSEYMRNNQSTEETHIPPESVLARRLAISNITRRRQLGYRDAHLHQTNSEALHPVGIRSETLPSRALSQAMPVVKYAALRILALPKPAGSESSFQCPYCHEELAVEEMNVQANWIRHVFQDLRPYICTFSDCPDPQRRFLTRHDWIYHEMQMHRLKWICQSCSREYVSKLGMTEHLQRVHHPSVRDQELTALLEMGERPIDEAHVDKCPFCQGSMSTEKLLDHMATHMEELALSSLLQNYEDTRETEDAMSHITRMPQPEGLSNPGTTSLSSSSHPSYESANSQPQTKQARSSGRKAKRCNCGQGPWNPEVTAHCHNCQHTLCGYCRSEQQNIRA
ncbi:hypothetical protein F4801DRAFT_592596 [Xylaria longipes]|nr:hypothetical protein F4801DRAFT_592596 [Xylaria longipes]